MNPFNHFGRSILLILLTLGWHLSAQAFGPGGTGGGDEVGLEFQQAFRSAYQEIQNRFPDIASQIEDAELAEVVQKAEIIIVDTTLAVQASDKEQISLAENQPARNRILVNRERWNALSDKRMRQAIAFHEVASLKGLESTGHYPLSGAFLANVGGDSEKIEQTVSGSPDAPSLESVFDRKMRLKMEARFKQEMKLAELLLNHQDRKLNCRISKIDQNGVDVSVRNEVLVKDLLLAAIGRRSIMEWFSGQTNEMLVLKRIQKENDPIFGGAVEGFVNAILFGLALDHDTISLKAGQNTLKADFKNGTTDLRELTCESSVQLK